MKTLLKDLPEHKERIEGNYSLSNDIGDIVGEILDYPDNESQEEYTNRILSVITDFVNENYEWKGIKA